MHRPLSCNFRWVNAFGNKLVAYRPGEIVRATQDDDGAVHRWCGSSGVSASCLHAALSGQPCRVHSYAGAPVKVDAEDASLQVQMLEAACQPHAESQHAALAVLATMQLSPTTSNALVHHLLHLWLHSLPGNVALLYFVYEQVDVKPRWLRTFIDIWAQAARRHLCVPCQEGGITCRPVVVPDERPAPTSKVAMQMPVRMCCNMCGTATRTSLTVPSPNCLTSTRLTTGLWKTRRARRKQVRLLRHLPVAALS